jgi:hypothetical protein
VHTLYIELSVAAATFQGTHHKTKKESETKTRKKQKDAKTENCAAVCISFTF